MSSLKMNKVVCVCVRVRAKLGHTLSAPTRLPPGPRGRGAPRSSAGPSKCLFLTCEIC